MLHASLKTAFTQPRVLIIHFCILKTKGDYLKKKKKVNLTGC